MNNIILPFLMSMLLGRTIDLRNYNIGGSIYDDADSTEISVGNLTATYHVVQDDIFPYNSFGLPADIVLRIKSNFLSASSGAMGLDGLLKEISSSHNSVIVGATIIYRTVNVELKEDAELLQDWKDRIPKTQTHYADKLFYGGWCVVLFKFKCDVLGDVQTVGKIVTDTLGVVGQLDNSTADLWKKAEDAISSNENIRGLVKVTSHVYSTVPINREILTPESLIKLKDDMSELVGSKGQPLFMNLMPLHELDEEYPKVQENVELLSDLEKMDQMLDDVKTTKTSMTKWITESLSPFSDEDEERVWTLLNKVNNCLRVFNKVSVDASLFKKADKSLIELAFHTYLIGLEKGLGTYNLAYMRLREEIDAECQDNYLHKIKGLLRVYDNEMEKKRKVEGGLEECKKLCNANAKCRAIGYSDHISELDLQTGRYKKEINQCWIYFRSTSTAIVYSPSGIFGDVGVYDRTCYL